MFDTLSSLENTIGAYSDATTFFSTNAENFQTDGYKELEWTFRSMFTKEMSTYGQANSASASASNTKSITTGVRLVPLGYNFSQGGLRAAEGKNAAINGEGFFVLKADHRNNFVYSRASDWVFDSSGTLRDTLGRSVKGYKAENNVVNAADELENIQIDFEKYTVDSIGIEDGGFVLGNYKERETARANEEAIPEADILFQLTIARIPNPEQLRAGTGNAFESSQISGTVTYHISGDSKIGDVRGGMVEASNVNPAETTVMMLQIQRAFNLIQQALQVNLKILTSITDVVGKA